MKRWVISLFCETAVGSVVGAAVVDMETMFTACVACTAKAGALVRLFAFSIYLLFYFQQVY